MGHSLASKSEAGILYQVLKENKLAMAYTGKRNEIHSKLSKIARERLINVHTIRPGFPYPLSWPGKRMLVLTPHIILAINYGRTC
jgi:hypothetical protein